jgi:hypothetical protein
MSVYEGLHYFTPHQKTAPLHNCIIDPRATMMTSEQPIRNPTRYTLLVNRTTAADITRRFDPPSKNRAHAPIISSSQTSIPESGQNSRQRDIFGVELSKFTPTPR